MPFKILYYAYPNARKEGLNLIWVICTQYKCASVSNYWQRLLVGISHHLQGVGGEFHM